ncbi:MAG: DUF3883 domain-containing protein, partial [Candidatus Rehaiarchaeum fermentans]|nr:DUF3883 domain-containing protein [Candidatus Rehaiarchaeum fermentans]
SSIDLAKREKYKDYITKNKWDVIVIDEAHRVGKLGNRETQRYKLASELTKNLKTNVILLSATPHRGKPEDYIERLRLIDPYLRKDKIKENESEFYKMINRCLVFRRTKLDVNKIYEKNRPIFTNCTFKARVVKASQDEIEFHKKLVEFLHNVLAKYHNNKGDSGSAIELLLVLIAKRASSSPKSALITLERILNKRNMNNESISSNNSDVEKIIETILGSGDLAEYDDDVLGSKKMELSDIIDEHVKKYSELLDEQDINDLKELYNIARRINGKTDSRLEAVKNIVKEHLKKGDKVVIFTEFKDTAKYIFEELKKDEGIKCRNKIALITSEEIVPPEVIGNKTNSSIEDVKKWLSNDIIKVLVSTDVASEGLNLQYANIIIHYEPSWSPIKIVQRIGRVWRLGQKKDVISYTVLLGVESDLRVLEILYGKLLSWYLAGVESNVIVGENIESDEEPINIDLLKNESKLKNESNSSEDLLVLNLGKGKRFSEYEAWLNFIERGKEGLEDYVTSILNTLKSLKEQAKMFNNEGEEKKIDKFLSAILKDLYGSKADNALVNILYLVANLKGAKVKTKDNRISVEGLCKAYKNNISTIYKCICSILKCNDENSPQTPIVLRATSLDETIDELAIYRVKLKIDERPYYSEVVGVKWKGSNYETIRGADLLENLKNALNDVIDVVDDTQDNNKRDKEVRKISGVVKDTVIKELLNPFISYIKNNEFHEKHNEWRPHDITRIPNPDIEYLGRIIFLKQRESTEKPKQITEAPPPIAIEEVERIAMEYAKKYEIEQGRKPKDVSKHEHYDIESRDPKTNEVLRYIEVKGKADNDIQVELTETEYEYARKLGKKYWLYIVYNISTKPEIKTIQDPINNVEWSEKYDKRFVVKEIKK